MAANRPRVEFRPNDALRARLELFRKNVEKKMGRRVSLSEVVATIVEEFFERHEKTS